MKEAVLVKGNRYGITLLLNNEASLDDIQEELKNKLHNSRKFFGNAKVTITLEGKVLSDEENHKLIEIVQASSDLQVVCLIDQNFNNTPSYEFLNAENGSNEVSTAKEQGTTAEQLESSSTNDALNCFHKGTLRSGQEVVSDSSVVVLGNVNNGASVVSKGNVIIIGKLSGYATAGSDGRKDAFVVALDMQPTQLKIGNVYGRPADTSQGTETATSSPQIAYVEDNHIVIEDISQSTYEHLSLFNTK